MSKATEEGASSMGRETREGFRAVLTGLELLPVGCSVSGSNYGMDGEGRKEG